MIDSDEFNIYGDETCHLLNDESSFMVLGATRCPKPLSHKISKQIKEFKVKHGLSPDFEIKSTKVSNGQLDFYKELIDYFINERKLVFRAVIIDKNILNHKLYHQTHTDFYYKMYYCLLKELIGVGKNYIYLDYKDTSSHKRCEYLNQVINNSFNFLIRQGDSEFHIQQINSKESNILQLTDLLIGLVCYKAKGLTTSQSKIELIHLLESNLDISLFETNRNQKFNILNWRPY